MGMPLDVLVFLRACDQKPSQDNVVLYGNLITEEYKDRKSTRLNSSHT